MYDSRADFLIDSVLSEATVRLRSTLSALLGVPRSQKPILSAAAVSFRFTANLLHHYPYPPNSSLQATPPEDAVTVIHPPTISFDFVNDFFRSVERKSGGFVSLR